MKTEELKRGVRDGIPICLGYFSVSAAYGMTAVLSGLPLSAAVIISLTNLTSAGQFAGTNLILAGGTYMELIMSMFIINIRYFLMSLSMSQKVEEKMTWPQRLAVSFGITDEIFAVSMQHQGPLSASYLAGLISRPCNRMDWRDPGRGRLDQASTPKRIQCPGDCPLRHVYCSSCAGGQKKQGYFVYSSLCRRSKCSLLLYAGAFLPIRRMEYYCDYDPCKRGGSAAVSGCRRGG